MQAYSPGPQVVTYLSEVDGTDQPYALYVPRNFDAGKVYPLLVALHGAGSDHRLNLRRVFGKGNLVGETDAEASRRFPLLADVDFIVASPLARGTMGYRGIAEKDVYDVLADVKKRFRIDDDRVYLTGLSMGGGGALWLGLSRPDIWAAIAAVCPAPPADAAELAPNALNTPVHLFQGSMDPLVPAEGVRRWHKRLLDLDSPVEYIEYPGVRHNSWDVAYKGAGIFTWFARFRRERFPDRVRFVSRRYRYRTAYWVELDGLKQGSLASIDAGFTAPNRLEIRTGDVDGFTLRLAGHAKYSPAQTLEAKIDGVVLRVKPASAISFVRAAAGWKAGRFAPPADSKRPGLEGPIAEVVAARHIYVYGTDGAADPDEILRRRAQALHAAEWSTPLWKVRLSFRVLADREVTDADLLSANLVAFGTKETNTLIARLASRLPLELNAGAADYGLVFVAPIGERYAVINSGLPWWTGAETSRRGGAPFVPAPLRLLESFGDYILFKGSLETVVAEGSFDANWRIPASASGPLSAAGTVRLR